MRGGAVGGTVAARSAYDVTVKETRRPTGRVAGHDGAQQEEAPRGWTLPVRFERGFPRAARVVRWMLGPRLVDLPLRALVIATAAPAFVPAGLESDAAGYLLLHYTSVLLSCAAAFVPRTAGIVSVAGYLVFLSQYPLLINPWDFPIAIAAAVLLSEGRWRWWLALLGLQACAYGLLLGADPTQHYVVQSAVPIWLQFALLALAARFMERRVGQEIALRAAAAERHREETVRMRLAVAADAHDTVSHGVAAQTAIIRLLSGERNPDGQTRLLGELALVTDRTQLELRRLLRVLRRPESGTSPEPVQVEVLLRQLDGLAQVAAIAGVTLTTEVGALPHRLSGRDAEQLQYLMRELVTNQVKHAPLGSACVISLDSSEDADGRSLILESRNALGAEPGREPWSLAARAAELGGDCSADWSGSEYRVSIRVPIAEAREDAAAEVAISLE